MFEFTFFLNWTYFQNFYAAIWPAFLAMCIQKHFIYYQCTNLLGPDARDNLTSSSWAPPAGALLDSWWTTSLSDAEPSLCTELELVRRRWKPWKYSNDKQVISAWDHKIAVNKLLRR